MTPESADIAALAAQATEGAPERRDAALAALRDYFATGDSNAARAGYADAMSPALRLLCALWQEHWGGLEDD